MSLPRGTARDYRASICPRGPGFSISPVPLPSGPVQEYGASAWTPRGPGCSISPVSLPRGPARDYRASICPRGPGCSVSWVSLSIEPTREYGASACPLNTLAAPRPQ